jgi:hypothetical protein
MRSVFVRLQVAASISLLLVSMRISAAPRTDAAEDARQLWTHGVSVDWMGVPLRQALVGLARSQGLGVVLDRRIDPGQMIDFSGKDLSLKVACVEIAEDRNLGFVALGPVAYFGPRPSARVVRTLAALISQQAEKLPSDRRAKFTAAKAWKWNDLATPRELVEQLAAEAGAKVGGLDLLPHDLWAASDLPALPLADRLALVTAQYDLAVRLEDGGRTIALVPQEAKVAIERSYSGGSDAEELAKRWAAKVPDATITLVGKTITVRGLVEEHELLRGTPTAARKSAPETGGTRVHSLKVDDIPVGKLLESLARTLDLDLKLDRKSLEAGGISLDKRVSLNVDKVSTLTLFKKLLNPVGLDARIEGNTLEVFVK